MGVRESLTSPALIAVALGELEIEIVGTDVRLEAVIATDDRGGDPR